MESDLGLKFVYFRDERILQLTGGGVICFAYQCTPERGLMATVCYCSPRDRFSRKIARRILTGRFKADRVVCVATAENKIFHMHELFREPLYDEAIDMIKTSYRTLSERWNGIVQRPSWADFYILPSMW